MAVFPSMRLGPYYIWPKRPKKHHMLRYGNPTMPRHESAPGAPWQLTFMPITRKIEENVQKKQYT
ncbi:hypothetical protein [Marinibacterium sp. SX1]|uniref:hypothetical protein n=1 Tax=Marinibacterium sp. SX1 TaxID=3388424 RepID=UPI003D16679B